MVANNTIQLNISRGEPFPLGVKKIQNAIHFSVAAVDRDQCQLNLYIKDSDKKYAVIVMDEQYRCGGIFSVAIEDLDTDLLEYTFEIQGKEFVDPCAHLVHGREEWGRYLSPEDKRKMRGRFDFSSFDWEADKNPMIPFDELIMYRLHMRGFTKHTSSKVKGKGTFLGCKEKIPYLKELGINAIEVMPIYEFDEIYVKNPYGMNAGMADYYYRNKLPTYPVDMPKVEPEYKLNYWGYSDSNYYFAPKQSYSYSDNPSKELKELIKELHRNGIELIMEMHFPFGTNQGVILSCLRYWVREFHVDGFRFNEEVVPATMIATDPYFSNVKLLCSGWDTYQVYGNRFPKYKNVAAYNDGFSVTMRRFLKGDEEQVSGVCSQLKANPEKSGKINYITNGNGFTLMDLYSYDVKHNEANGEENTDGSDYNYSWNCGTEGKTRKKKVLELRRKQIRNAFVLLLLSQATPMILSGDEFGNSQEGNNNAYCQDNEISWLNWNQLRSNKEQFEFVKSLIQLRKEHPILHMEDEMRNMDYISCGYPDMSFHGTKAWCPDYSNYSRVLGVMICGKYIRIDHSYNDNFFYFACNMHWETHTFDVPHIPADQEWTVVVDTFGEEDTKADINSGLSTIVVQPRSIVILMSQKNEKLNQRGK
ncbi:glycogen debranching enzyme [Lachnospiraceae bacterium KM106-2]|nr:glycogen debranching enzyme [Lachnospiraceae bacterium KM106-2]